MGSPCKSDDGSIDVAAGQHALAAYNNIVGDQVDDRSLSNKAKDSHGTSTDTHNAVGSLVQAVS